MIGFNNAGKAVLQETKDKTETRSNARQGVLIQIKYLDKSKKKLQIIRKYDKLKAMKQLTG